MKTYSLKATDVARTWYLLDATGISLGRLSTVVAGLLLGKGKSNFSPHVDGGDFVVIINASELKITGNKLEGKKYYRHSGYPSGLTTRTLADLMASDPDKVIRQAVRGMLPANKLRPARLARLKVYGGEDHSHAPQNPTKLELEKTK